MTKVEKEKEKRKRDIKKKERKGWLSQVSNLGKGY